MKDVPLIIMSHKRADRVDTQFAFTGCSICVEESQAEEYSAFNPNLSVITHPDSVKGLAAKYKWIHKNFKTVVVLGDDISSLRRMFLGPDDKDGQDVDPDTAYDIVQTDAFVAKQIGVQAWSFGKEMNPLTYSGHKPFHLSGLISGGCIGFFDKFPMDELPDNVVAGIDYFTSGLNAYYFRKTFIDMRYFTGCREGTFVSTGGQADFRTIDTEKNDFLLLKRNFGDAIDFKKNSLLRKHKHEYEKTFRLPY